MTRERFNELKRLSKERYESEHEQRLFMDGAEYADSHPRKGLADIEKAVEWLDDNFEKYNDFVGLMRKPLIKAFRKAMLEEE